MTNSFTQPVLSGPLEERAFPERLTARVVAPGPVTRLHGYDVERDLAVHYGVSELALLSLTGELPTDVAVRMYRVASAFLAPVSVAHASTHAAVLSRLCGTTTSATVGAAGIGLAEQARALLDEHDELLAWLAQPSGELPARYRATDSSDGSSVVRLIEALARNGCSVPTLNLGPTRSAALVAVLHACGLRDRSAIEAAIVLARLPVALSEAFAERVANFAAYPINLPRFRYEE